MSAQQDAVTQTPSGPSTPGREPAKRYSGRIGGLDIARCLAIFGMFVAHMAPRQDPETFTDVQWVKDHPVLAHIPDGRSAILFAVLAGVSLAILTGRNVPYEGERMRTARLRIAGRALTLMVIAMVAGFLGTPVLIILSYYAVWFIVALPFTFWTPRKLFTLSAILAVVGPIATFMLPWLMNSLNLRASEYSDTLFLWDIFVSGTYPGLVYMAFVFAGMGIGRCDLSSRIVHARLVVSGAVLMVIGYGSSWLLTRRYGKPGGLNKLDNVSGGTNGQIPEGANGQIPEGAEILGSLPPGTQPSGNLSGNAGMDSGSSLTETPQGIFHWDAAPLPEIQEFTTAEAHTNTVFETIGSGGFALTVLGLCLLAGGLARHVLYPVASVGSMALTAYVAHLFAIGLQPPNKQIATSWSPLVGFVIGLLVACTLWRRFFKRGPLEWVTWKVSMITARMPMTRAERRQAEEDAQKKGARAAEEAEATAPGGDSSREASVSGRSAPANPSDQSSQTAPEPPQA
ncbi:MAG: DUF418 domain-containing protein [Actinomycetaceae bacterium]|nr:DUF418 domain-containing protein [Actinomycetaceae bacterium]